MLPSEVRAKVLGDHDALRVLLEELEALARRALSGDLPDDARLREAGAEFHAILARHMAWEDNHLAPALQEIDAWGPERVARLREEHAEQRDHLARSLEHLRDPNRDLDGVAHDLLELAAWLRRDMEGEEREALDPKVLRDDVISINLEAG